MYLTQGLHRAVTRHPEKLATVFGDRERTFAEMHTRVAKLAAALRESGMGAGARVAILAANSDWYVEAIFATWWAAGVICPINSRWSIDEAIFALNDSQAVILLVDDDSLDYVPVLRHKSKSVKNIIHAGVKPTPSDISRYEEILEVATPIEDVRCNGDTLCTLLYTGGTTGVSKAAMLSHTNLWAPVISRIAELPPPPDCTTLHVAPLFHMGALQRMVYQVIIGGTQVILPSYDTAAALQCIERHSVNDIFLVPSMLQMMLDHPGFKGFKDSTLRRISHGASPISESLLERAMQVFPGVEFSTTYGMTEIGVATVSLPENYHLSERASGRIKSVGRVGYGVELRILDAEGKELPPFKVGEIVVKGPGVMSGYWRRPVETQEALRNGWMHTGDGGYLDEDGYLFVVDRIKDMIITGGENVYSVEVEGVLARHPAIKDVAVIGVPHELWGEAVHAVLVLKDAHAVSFDDIKAYCRGKLAGYKCPKSIEIRDALPLSKVGKPMKAKLRSEWKVKNSPQPMASH